MRPVHLGRCPSQGAGTRRRQLHQRAGCRRLPFRCMSTRRKFWTVCQYDEAFGKMDMGAVPNPAGPAASSEAECATEEQSAVKRRAASNNIRGDAPEGGTDNQPNEERTCRKSRVVFWNAEFGGQWRQSQSNTLNTVSRTDDASGSSSHTCSQRLWGDIY